MEGNNLIISSPTSSGKIFVGEIAAVKEVMEKKKVIYTVPLKSLANEKYSVFTPFVTLGLPYWITAKPLSDQFSEYSVTKTGPQPKSIYPKGVILQGS